MMTMAAALIDASGEKLLFLFELQVDKYDRQTEISFYIHLNDSKHIRMFGYRDGRKQKKPFFTVTRLTVNIIFMHENLSHRLYLLFSLHPTRLGLVI